MKPEISLGISLATGAVVYGIYQTGLPSVADARVSMPGDKNLEGARRSASWTAAAVVGGVSLIAKDPTVFVLGGAMIIGLDWWFRHAAAVHPATGKVVNGAPTPPPSMGDADVTNYAG